MTKRNEMSGGSCERNFFDWNWEPVSNFHATSKQKSTRNLFFFNRQHAYLYGIVHFGNTSISDKMTIILASSSGTKDIYISYNKKA